MKKPADAGDHLCGTVMAHGRSLLAEVVPELERRVAAGAARLPPGDQRGRLGLYGNVEQASEPKQDPTSTRAGVVGQVVLGRPGRRAGAAGSGAGCGSLRRLGCRGGALPRHARADRGRLASDGITVEAKRTEIDD